MVAIAIAGFGVSAVEGGLCDDLSYQGRVGVSGDGRSGGCC